MKQIRAAATASADRQKVRAKQVRRGKKLRQAHTNRYKYVQKCTMQRWKHQECSSFNGPFLCVQHKNRSKTCEIKRENSNHSGNSNLHTKWSTKRRERRRKMDKKKIAKGIKWTETVLSLKMRHRKSKVIHGSKKQGEKKSQQQQRRQRRRKNIIKNVRTRKIRN